MIKEKYKLLKKAESAFLNEIIGWLYKLLYRDKISVWDVKLRRTRDIEEIFKCDGTLRFILKGGK
jgi:hypothetical protein